MEQSSVPSSRGSNPHPQKNECPICGQLKTAWSLKCGTCESNRQRYLAAIEREDSDRAFLDDVKQRKQSDIARERGITRQRVGQLVSDARKRVAFLEANPLPPIPTFRTLPQTPTETNPVH